MCVFMEPFNITLHQVNYEEGDTNHYKQHLDSFSNLVSYESPSSEPHIGPSQTHTVSPQSSFNYKADTQALASHRLLTKHKCSDEDLPVLYKLSSTRLGTQQTQQQEIDQDQGPHQPAPVHSSKTFPLQEENENSQVSLASFEDWKGKLQFSTPSLMGDQLTGEIKTISSNDHICLADCASENQQGKQLIRIPSDTVTITKDKLNLSRSQLKRKQNRTVSEETLTTAQLSGSELFPTDQNQQYSQSAQVLTATCNTQLTTAVSKEKGNSSSYQGHFLNKEPGVYIPLSTVNVKDSELRTLHHSPPVKEISFQPIIKSKPVLANTPGFVDERLDISLLEQSAEHDNHPSMMAQSPIAASTPNVKKNIQSLNRSTPCGNEAIEVVTYPVDEPVMQHKFSKYEELLQEKVYLEGQLEFMSEEMKSIVEQRTELQTAIFELQRQLEAAAHPSKSTSGQYESEFFTDLEMMKHDKVLLAQNIYDLERSVEEMSAECQSTKQELDLSEQNNVKMQERIEHLRHELSSKDVTIQTLKDKIAELYVQTQNTLQGKIKTEKEKENLKGEIDNLVSTKQWLQDQLRSTQQSRVLLQADYTRVQTSLVNQVSLAEKLSMKNSILKQELAETTQKALKEKERITQYLEAIEADMLERESVLEEINSEQSTSKGLLQSKLQRTEQERLKLFNMASKSADLEDKVNKVEGQLKREEAEVSTLESQQQEIMTRLNLSQGALSERDSTIESLQQQISETEMEIRTMKKHLQTKDATIVKQSSELEALESSLAIAKEEKHLTHSILSDLKGRVTLMEEKYKEAKNEVNEKAKEIQKLKSEMKRFEVKLSDQTNALTRNHDYKTNLAAMVKLVDQLKQENVHLEDRVSFLQSDGLKQRSQYEAYITEKRSWQNELDKCKIELEDLKKQMQTKAAMISKLEGQLEMSQSEDKIIEQLRHDNSMLKMSLSKTETQAHRELAEYKVKVTKLTDDVSKSHQILQEMQGTLKLKCDENTQLKTANTDLKNNLKLMKQKQNSVMTEIEDLRQKSEETQCLGSQFEQEKQGKNDLKKQLIEVQNEYQLDREQLKGQIESIEKELETANKLLEGKELLEEENRTLCLALEKERGRLTGVKQSYSSLKKHAALLEEQLAHQEISQTPCNHGDLGQIEQQTTELTESRNNLQDVLNKERDNNKLLRKQVALGKGENIKSKRAYDGAKQEINQLNQDVQHYKQRAEKAAHALDKLQQSQMDEVRDRDDTGNQSLQDELAKVNRALEDLQSQNLVKDDQMKSLNWELDQKKQMMSAEKQQQQSTEKRLKVELRNLKSMLMVTQGDLESVKVDVKNVRRDKFTFQAKVAELRGALKASVQQNKTLKAQMETNASQEGQNDLAQIEEILNATNPQPLNKCLPINSLQECLQSLRTEVGSLQKQVESQTTATSESWREVETHIQDLRNICRSPKLSVNSSTTDLTVYSSVDKTPGRPTSSTDSSTNKLPMPGCIDI